MFFVSREEFREGGDYVAVVYNNFTIIIITQPSLSAPPLSPPPPQPKEVSVRKGSLFQLRRSDSGVKRKVRNRTLNHIFLRCHHNLNAWDRPEKDKEMELRPSSPPLF